MIKLLQCSGKSVIGLHGILSILAGIGMAVYDATHASHITGHQPYLLSFFLFATALFALTSSHINQQHRLNPVQRRSCDAE
ncbi:MAG: hypothetical protein WC477_03320 [Patescibacteria group bacterium]